MARFLLLATALALGACQSTGSPSLATADNNFIMQAAAGGMGEVELGQLAQQRAADASVRRFGAQMVADHTTANQELVRFAGRKGVTRPTALDPGRANAGRQLATLSGASFDQQYMAQQVQDHGLQAALYQQQAQSGADPDLRAFAARYLPVVQGHAQMARSVFASVAAPAR